MKIIIVIIIVILSNSLYAQDSCYTSIVFKSKKLQLECLNKKSELDIVATIKVNKLSIAIEVEIMGLIKHSNFVIIKVDSCRKTESGFEYIYEVEEDDHGDAELTNGKSILKISKNNNSYIFDIIPIKKDGCSTKFQVTEYKKSEF